MYGSVPVRQCCWSDAGRPPGVPQAASCLCIRVYWYLLQKVLSGEYSLASGLHKQEKSMHACMQVYGKHLRGEGSDVTPPLDCYSIWLV